MKQLDISEVQEMNLTFTETAKLLNTNRANLYRFKVELAKKGYLVTDTDTLLITEEGVRYIEEKLSLKQRETTVRTSETAFETIVKQYETSKKMYENSCNTSRRKCFK